MIVLSGKKVREEKIPKLKEKLQKENKTLGLAVIQIGSSEPSTIYKNQLKKLAKELNYYFLYKHFTEKEEEENIITYIKKLNNNKKIHGILVELPIPKKYNKEKILNTISWKKDIDGQTKDNINKGYLNLLPCTALSILDIISYYNIDIKSFTIAVIGKSTLVGKPIKDILEKKCKKIELLDTKTKKISTHTKKCDMIIIAIGKAHLLTDKMIKDGAIIMDVGINIDNKKIKGDVDESVYKKASYITPVPGGIGALTPYEVMHNTYIASTLSERKEK